MRPRCRPRPSRRLWLAAAAALLGTAAAGSPMQAAAPAFPTSTGISPPYANDFDCRPAAAHPLPVVLVHGTFEDMTMSWPRLSPILHARGYCVFALDYGNRGTARIEDSAVELSRFVDRVLTAMHASKVLIVGHSQGGMMPRYYMRFLGGAAKVAGLVGLAPSNHGTTNPLTPVVAPTCPACAEQEAGSAFLQRLNAGGDTLPGVRYTVVETVHDEVVTPYTSALLTGPAVTDVVLQQHCPRDASEHIAIQYDAVALAWVVDALDRGGRADPSFRPGCGVVGVV